MSSPGVGAERLPASGGRFELPLAGLAGAAAFSVVFLLPVFGCIGVPLAAVPSVRLSHRQGLLAGLGACGVVGALVFGLGWASAGLGSGLALGFVAFGVAALPTASVGFLRAGVDPSRCYLGICLAGCALVAAAYFASVGSGGAALSAQVTSTFDQGIPPLLDQYARSGADAESVARMREAFEAAREFSRNYLWGMLGALWVLSSAIAYYLGAAAARPAATADTARFEGLRVPAAGAALFVAAGLVFGLLGGEGRRIAGNLLLPLLALYFAAGLSIICHFFRRWFRVWILRVGLYALVAYLFPLNFGVVLLGLFDWYVDFRRRGEGVREKS
jgi:Predicted membrane protein (DUF2232)